MKTKAWALTVTLAVLPTLPADAGVFYSPVFNMPLQPAPSPCDGGFYWVLPDGRVYGPNYYLMPPFTPMTGFNNTFIGQRIFAKLHEEYITGAQKQGPGGPGGGGQPPAKQVGVGGYKMDYSDPNTFKNFDATAPMINGYVPFGPTQQPQQQYGNGPMPTPRYSANYPNFQASAAPAGGYGYSYAGMSPPQRGVYQAGYYDVPQYYQTGYYGGNYNPIMQVQAHVPQAYCPPGMPYPQGQPMGPACANPGYACMPGTPCLPAPSMPYYPTPTMSMPYYQTPPNPNYAMPQACFPNLPNPSYEPPPCNDANQQPRYYMNPLVRSPRDYFMWSEVQEDRLARARRPLTVP